MSNNLTSTNVFKVEGNQFFTWLSLLSFKHKLTEKEVGVASRFLDAYFKNKEKIINDDLLNEVTLSLESKRKIREELQLTPTYFQIILKALRDKRFLIDGKINQEFIPVFNQNNHIILTFLIKGSE